VIRRALLAVGFASAGSGLLLLLTPVRAPFGVPILPTLGLLALAALAVGALVALDRSSGGVETAELPDPSAGVAVPGDAFDDRLGSVSARRDEADREAIRERLERVAVTVLADATGSDRPTVRQRLADGTWTDDPRASAFFTGRPPSLRARLRTVVTGESTFVRRARRVVAVLAARTEGER